MSFPFHPPTRDMDYYYGIPILQSGSAQGANFFNGLSGLLGQQRAEGDEQRMVQMAAQRLSRLGGEGAQWAQQIQKDPRAALMLADEHGGFGAIESRLMAAHASGAAGEAIGQMQESGASPQEIVNFILRTQGPEAAKKTADALGLGAAVKPTQVIDPVTGQPTYVDASDAIGKAPVPRSGMRIEFDENGRPIVTTGGASDLTNPSRTRIEGKQVDAADSLSRIARIRAAFKPEYQTVGEKARMSVLKGRVMMGQELSPEDKSSLSDYAAFRAAAFETMSAELNRLSGAAISPHEAERLKQYIPDPGTGLFDGDDWITFDRKLTEFDSQLRGSIDRYAAEKRGGLDVVPPKLPVASRQESIQAKPLPPKDQLVEGEVYQTKKGPARWNGASFSLVK